MSTSPCAKTGLDPATKPQLVLSLNHRVYAFSEMQVRDCCLEAWSHTSDAGPSLPNNRHPHRRPVSPRYMFCSAGLFQSASRDFQSRRQVQEAIRDGLGVGGEM